MAEEGFVVEAEAKPVVAEGIKAAEEERRRWRSRLKN